MVALWHVLLHFWGEAGLLALNRAFKRVPGYPFIFGQFFP